jgi:hypothetical protein
VGLSDIISGTVGDTINQLTQLANEAVAEVFYVVATPTEESSAHFGAAFGRDYDGEHMTLIVRETGFGGLAKKVAGQLIPIQWGGLAVQNDLIFVTDKFLVEAASEDRSCRFVPLFTFGQTIGYSSGDNPYVFRYSGKLLINKLDGDSRNQFDAMYRKYLRASSNLRGKKHVAIPWVVEANYRDMYRKGYIIDCSISVNSMQPAMAELSFSMFVIEDRFNK